MWCRLGLVLLGVGLAAESSQNVSHGNATGTFHALRGEPNNAETLSESESESALSGERWPGWIWEGHPPHDERAFRNESARHVHPQHHSGRRRDPDWAGGGIVR
eukprot:CAMPEP_0181473402 /NCGR_PEP_ID=MMETSP1110-20121109/40104_1 /TAXON_ID=174948 /ORGANISM="Symbiodinium sp., Strain CCMP421" /LENGTH=103 /DNA_ID=CAMNT_0023598515 /DNA_START=54 /DNA_END=365 /DNA_ORIENTATION=+